MRNSGKPCQIARPLPLLQNKMCDRREEHALKKLNSEKLHNAVLRPLLTIIMHNISATMQDS